MIAIISNFNISTTQETNNQGVNNQVKQINNQQILQNPNYLPNNQQQQEQYQQYNGNIPINYNNDNLNLGNQQQPEQFIKNNIQISTPGAIPGQNQVNNNLPSEHINNQSNNNNATGVITMNSSEIIEELYPKNAFALFHNIRDANKEDKQTLRVDIVLTRELCDAILKKDRQKVIQILLNKNVSGITKTVLEKCIYDMVDRFKQSEDLQCMLKYLEITDGKATYSPVSTMTDWLKSLDFFKDIEDVAKPFLEDKEDGKVVQSYELRASVYVKTDKNSEIKVPKKDKLSLVTNLEQCKKDLIQKVNNKKQKLSKYDDVLDFITLQKELDRIKKDERITQLNSKKNELTKEEQSIKDKIIEIIKSRNESLKAQYNKLGNRRTQSAINNLWCIKNNKDKIKSDEELYKLTDKNNKTIYDIIQKYKKDKEKLENELNPKIAELSKLEQECAPILKKITELEDKLKNVDKTKINNLKSKMDKYNSQIQDLLQQAKEYFENKSPNNKK